MPEKIDLDRLDERLSSDHRPEECMCLSDLDGSMHGIVCGPVMISVEEWLPVAFGGDPWPAQHPSRRCKMLVKQNESSDFCINLEYTWGVLGCHLVGSENELSHITSVRLKQLEVTKIC